MMRRRIRLAFLPYISLLAGLTLAACANEPPPDTLTQEIAPPPSVRTAGAPGAALVRLSPLQADALDVHTAIVGRDTAVYEVSLPGEVSPSPEHFAVVSAPISGRVVTIHAHEGEAIRLGQPLLALESLEFASLAADYLQAVAEEHYLQRQVDRLDTLVARKVTPRSRLDRARADLLRAQAGTSATYARLKAVGITDDQIARWSGSARERPLLEIYAPLSGYVDRHAVDLGQSVTAYQEMLTIVDPARVLIRGFVSPDDARAIRPGDPVTIRMRDVPGPALTAAVATINPAVDPESRSVVVNILAATRDRWPMPGQTVQLAIRARDPRPVLRLPLSAVQYEGEQATVFVQRDRLTYERRPVQIDRLTDDAVIVTAGLRDGEAVAVSQVFSLKAIGRFEQYAEE